MTKSLRVLMAAVVIAAMAYGAALTLALTGNLGSATAIVVVAAGDLTTEVPVSRDDELGNITAHFNQMTRVLRDRAEEQGRFAAAGELLSGVAHEVNNPLMAIA